MPKGILKKPGQKREKKNRHVRFNTNYDETWLALHPDIETEYFKRQGPENIMDILLHQNSMAGTIWENKWDSISDVEKVGILLNDTEIADRLNYKKKRKKTRRNPLTRNQKIEQLEDSLRIMRTKLEVYEQTVKWFRNADIDELQRGIEEIRNMPKEVPLQ